MAVLALGISCWAWCWGDGLASQALKEERDVVGLFSPSLGLGVGAGSESSWVMLLKRGGPGTPKSGAALS